MTVTTTFAVANTGGGYLGGSGNWYAGLRMAAEKPTEDAARAYADYWLGDTPAPAYRIVRVTRRGNLLTGRPSPV